MAFANKNFSDSAFGTQVQSAGLSRIWQHIQNCQCGSISAFRQYRNGWEHIDKTIQKKSQSYQRI